jgi:hypothetical protein
MTTGTAQLGRSSAAFAMAAAVTALFNTGLSWVKDAYSPLLKFMNSVAGHNWTTQGLADVILFAGLGLIFWKTGWAEKIAPSRLISFLVGSVVVAGVGLFAWYALY